jgi:hypothetical protein
MAHLPLKKHGAALNAGMFYARANNFFLKNIERLNPPIST